MPVRAICAVAAALLLTACGTDAPAPPQTPATTAPVESPVIIYLIDTLRADRLGLYGYDKPTSPVIDALAKESVVFERAYAPAPWTLPSVASMLTSTFTCEHGLVVSGLSLNPALTTLAERLQAAGFATAAHYQNATVGPLAGLDRGYQVSELHPPHLGNLSDAARDFVGRVDAGPFLLYLHTMEPHNAFDVPPSYLKPFGHVSIDDRETFRALGDVYRMAMLGDLRGMPTEKPNVAGIDLDRSAAEMARLGNQVRLLYDASVLHADTNLAEVIDTLREAGVWDRSLFILLADHGEEFGEHGYWFHGHSVYEELLRVPLLIRFPGGEFGGRRVGQPVSLLDLVPTILDLQGLGDSCTGCRGRSLLSLLRDPEASADRGSEVAAIRVNRHYYSERLERERGDINVAVIDGSDKGIWNADVARMELYDLQADPAEQTDLRSREAARADQMKAAAEAWLADCQQRLRSPLESPDRPLDQETRENLRALGYLR